MSDKVCSICGFDYTNYPENHVNTTCTFCGKTHICGCCAGADLEDVKKSLKNKSFVIPWKCCKCNGREPLSHEEIAFLISLKTNIEDTTLEELLKGLEEEDSDEKENKEDT